MSDYLHNHSEFEQLLRAVEHEKGIDSSLIEKDYWIMHVLYGLQQGGFDDVTPNELLTVSSWALDFAQKNKMDVVDNKAYEVKCYHPGFTFVEKLQTIATKFRQQQETGKMPANFIRHYYDVACLLDSNIVQEFIGTQDYKEHKNKRFPRKEKELPLFEQEAFLLNDSETRELFEKEYKKTKALYYQGQISLTDILGKISKNLDRL